MIVDEQAGRVFVTDTSYGGGVSAIDPKTAGLLWTRRVDRRVYAFSVAVDRQRGHAFVSIGQDGFGHARGTVAMLDARTGALLHTAEVGVRPVNMALDTRLGHVIVSNVDGSVTMLDAGTGTVLTRLFVGPTAGPVAVDETSYRAFIITSYGNYSGRRGQVITGTRGSPERARRSREKRGRPCLRRVAMEPRMRQNRCAPTDVRKQPEIFSRTLVMRMSRSA